MTIGPAAGDLSCDVWWAAPVDPSSAPGLVALLDDHERERLTRFRRSEDAGRYLAAHALVRLVLADRVEEPAGALALDRLCRCGAQHGKPTLAEHAGPHFSLTHGGDVVGVAVCAGGPVGLDVEQIRELPDLPGMLRHTCSPTELARGGPSGFFTTWTRKEALLKATGDGLTTPMASITLGPHGVEEWTGDKAPNGPIWLRDLRPAPGYAGAVAGLGRTPAEVLVHDGDAVLANVSPGSVPFPAA